MLRSTRRLILQNRAVPVVIFLILGLSGTNLVFAAQNSLPGDVLYPMKTSLIEPIEVAVAPSPLSKAAVQANIIDERLKEATLLAARDKLTPAIQSSLQSSIQAQAQALAENLNAAPAADASTTESIRARFNQDMIRQANALDGAIFKHGDRSPSAEPSHASQPGPASAHHDIREAVFPAMGSSTGPMLAPHISDEATTTIETIQVPESAVSAAARAAAALVGGHDSRHGDAGDGHGQGDGNGGRDQNIQQNNNDAHGGGSDAHGRGRDH